MSGAVRHLVTWLYRRVASRSGIVWWSRL